MPDWDFEQDFESLHVLPLISVTVWRCENPNCGEAHGILLAVGWLFWTVNIGFLFSTEE